MKPNTKEILKNKADKIIDLIIDEVKTGGQKEITASFTDEKTGLKNTLTVKVEVTDPTEPTLDPFFDEGDIPIDDDF